jgi:hypothetical protein
VRSVAGKGGVVAWVLGIAVVRTHVEGLERVNTKQRIALLGEMQKVCGCGDHDEASALSRRPLTALVSAQRRPMPSL